MGWIRRLIWEQKCIFCAFLRLKIRFHSQFFAKKMGRKSEEFQEKTNSLFIFEEKNDYSEHI